jgi:DNA-binding transcriptional LysR family regulator
MHNRINWDDLRYVLAVTAAGSVSGAARALQVNHATVLRRIASFETAHNIEIFDKSARGYAILDDRLKVIEAVREVETAIKAVHQVIEGTQAPLRGIVRVTSTDTFCNIVLPPMLARLQALVGELRVELLSTNAHLDMSRLHADITVRPARTLPDELEGEVAASLAFDVYAVPECDSDSWLGLSGTLSRSVVADWFADRVHDRSVRGAADSFLTLRELAISGLGQAILPCVLGDGDARLERRRAVMPPLAVDIWVASHRDLAQVPRISAVRRLLVTALNGDRHRLAGQGATRAS